MKNSNEMYENVIFMDECTMQLDQHRRICFRKKYQRRLLKPRAKHPAKIHIWGRISYRGATNVIMFTGNMDVPRYKQLLEAGLLPFIEKCYPDGHRLHQDNDPKHSSKLIENCFTEKGVVWLRTLPESPDLNPIENIWGSLKQFPEHHSNHMI